MKKTRAASSENLKRKYKIVHPVIAFFVELVVIVTSFVLAVISCTSTVPSYLLVIISSFWVAAIAVKIWIFVSGRITTKAFLQMQTSEALAASTLLAQQRANEAKARTIQQMTYGRVPEWHPMNFQDNVLVYDVHEQLRTILIEIRNAVLTYSGKSDADMVTVDLAYCYPDKDYSGMLPTPDKNRSAWRIITSGDSSCMNYKLHDFLGSNESFYFHLDQNNYVFFNDKQAVDRYYLPSGKDHEYGGIGSIVGMAVSLKNDAPESVLVKAMLTITTYGWKLCEDDSKVSADAFRDIFKQNVLNGYKSLLKSELAQMYIRHMIRDQKMCPFTGIILGDQREDTDKPPCPPFRCPLNPNRRKEECPYKAETCKCINVAGGSDESSPAAMAE